MVCIYIYDMANMIQYHLIYISAIILLRSGRLYAQVAKPNTWQSRKSQGLFWDPQMWVTQCGKPPICGLPHLWITTLFTINHHKPCNK